MPRRATVQFWRTLLVVLTMGLPLHAQSGSESSSWSLVKFDPNERSSLPFTHSCPASAVGPAAASTGSRENSRPLPFAPDTPSNDVNADSASVSGELGPKPAPCGAWSRSQQQIPVSSSDPWRLAVDSGVGGDSKSSSASVAVVRPHGQPDLDRGVYYRNKLEFGFDGGWLPINIPFVFDVFLGDAYTMTGLRYTLVPLVASLRWHMDDVGGPWILRGNWDLTVSGSITAIPRGPETRYFSYDMGIRRNFVPHRGKVAPYFDGRLGLGEIDAKEPLGVQYAQGQNFTFTMNLGAGARYNFNPRYSFSAGLNWMHISNLYISQPEFSNYGINVYGPMFGIDIRLSKPRHASE